MHERLLSVAALLAVASFLCFDPTLSEQDIRAMQDESGYGFCCCRCDAVQQLWIEGRKFESKLEHSLPSD